MAALSTLCSACLPLSAGQRHPNQRPLWLGSRDVQTYFGLPVRPGKFVPGRSCGRACLAAAPGRGGTHRPHGGKAGCRWPPVFTYCWAWGRLIVRRGPYRHRIPAHSPGAFCFESGSATPSLRMVGHGGRASVIFTNEAGRVRDRFHCPFQVDHPAEQGGAGHHGGVSGHHRDMHHDVWSFSHPRRLCLTAADPGVRLTIRAFANVYGDWVCIPIALCP